MSKIYFLLFLFLSSCVLEKKLIVVNDDKNYTTHSKQVSNLVDQVLNYYQKSYSSDICTPHAQDDIDSQIENDLRKAKKVRISEVLQHNQYYIDIAFLISARKDPLFLRIVLKDDMCYSFMLEDFKLYDKR